jgi:transcriptional regulator with XRE-family HTH domain
MQIRLREGAMYRYCAEQSISRDELARRMGVASTTAYRVECGDVEPSPRFIAALMHTTGKRFEQLFEIVPAEAVA